MAIDDGHSSHRPLILHLHEQLHQLNGGRDTRRDRVAVNGDHGVVDHGRSLVGHRVLGEARRLGAHREAIRDDGLLAAELTETLNTVEASKARDLCTKSVLVTNQQEKELLLL